MTTGKLHWIQTITIDSPKMDDGRSLYLRVWWMMKTARRKVPYEVTDKMEVMDDELDT